MLKYKIVLARNKCIGCGACVMANDKYYEMREDGRSELKGNEKREKNLQELGPIEKDYEINIEAAESCPVNCIHIYKIKKDNSEEKVI